MRMTPQITIDEKTFVARNVPRSFWRARIMIRGLYYPSFMITPALEAPKSPMTTNFDPVGEAYVLTYPVASHMLEAEFYESVLPRVSTSINYLNHNQGIHKEIMSHSYQSNILKYLAVAIHPKISGSPSCILGVRIISPVDNKLT